MPEMDLRWPSVAGLNFICTSDRSVHGMATLHYELRAARLARYFAEDLGRLETRRQEEARIEQVIEQSGLDCDPRPTNTGRVQSRPLKRFTEPCRRRYEATFTEDFGGFKALFRGSAGAKPFQ